LKTQTGHRHKAECNNSISRRKNACSCAVEAIS